MGFQVRVHGAWGTMCLPVPNKLHTPSGSEAFRLLYDFLSVPLEVKVAWKPDRTVCLRY